MRKIKFRGIDKYNKFHYGDLTSYSKSISYITEELLENKVYKVITSTVNQYIGIKDKDGLEIYENDIVRIHQFLFDGNEYENEITIQIVYIEELACYGAKLINAEEIKKYMSYENDETPIIPLCNLYGLHEESYQKLGNIYQEKELLMVTKNVD